MAETIFAEAVPKGEINDHLDTSPKNSGGRIVGITLGVVTSSRFDPEDVRVAMPSSNDQTICVTGISGDGLYWTRTPYQINSEAPATSQVKLSRFTDQYEAQLKGYRQDELAILAFASAEDTCLIDDGLILPVLSETAYAPVSEISALVNSGTLDVSITVEANGTRTEAVCVPPSTSERIAFDRACRITVKLSNEPQDMKIIITTDDGLATLEKDYTVRMPAHE